MIPYANMTSVIHTLGEEYRETSTSPYTLYTGGAATEDEFGQVLLIPATIEFEMNPDDIEELWDTMWNSGYHCEWMVVDLSDHPFYSRPLGKIVGWSDNPKFSEIIPLEM